MVVLMLLVSHQLPNALNSTITMLMVGVLQSSRSQACNQLTNDGIWLQCLQPRNFFWLVLQVLPKAFRGSPSCFKGFAYFLFYIGWCVAGTPLTHKLSTRRQGTVHLSCSSWQSTTLLQLLTSQLPVPNSPLYPWQRPRSTMVHRLPSSGEKLNS